MSYFFFFFSSRRRHTRCSRDWSSDVCSSDLLLGFIPHFGRVDHRLGLEQLTLSLAVGLLEHLSVDSQGLNESGVIRRRRLFQDSQCSLAGRFGVGIVTLKDRKSVV